MKFQGFEESWANFCSGIHDMSIVKITWFFFFCCLQIHEKKDTPEFVSSTFFLQSRIQAWRAGKSPIHWWNFQLETACLIRGFPIASHVWWHRREIQCSSPIFHHGIRTISDDIWLSSSSHCFCCFKPSLSWDLLNGLLQESSLADSPIYNAPFSWIFPWNLQSSSTSRKHLGEMRGFPK